MKKKSSQSGYKSSLKRKRSMDTLSSSEMKGLEGFIDEKVLRFEQLLEKEFLKKIIDPNVFDFPARMQLFTLIGFIDKDITFINKRNEKLKQRMEKEGSPPELEGLLSKSEDLKISLLNVRKELYNRVEKIEKLKRLSDDKIKEIKALKPIFVAEEKSRYVRLPPYNFESIIEDFGRVLDNIKLKLLNGENITKKDFADVQDKIKKLEMPEFENKIQTILENFMITVIEEF